jgi:hypothetical protein
MCLNPRESKVFGLLHRLVNKVIHRRLGQAKKIKKMALERPVNAPSKDL